jgi:hypothetical protein
MNLLPCSSRALAAFWVLCLTQAHSDKLANVFFCFLGSLILLYMLARFGFGLGEKLLGRASCPFDWPPVPSPATGQVP